MGKLTYVNKDFVKRRHKSYKSSIKTKKSPLYKSGKNTYNGIASKLCGRARKCEESPGITEQDNC